MASNDAQVLQRNPGYCIEGDQDVATNFFDWLEEGKKDKLNFWIKKTKTFVFSERPAFIYIYINILRENCKPGGP